MIHTLCSKFIFVNIDTQIKELNTPYKVEPYCIEITGTGDFN